MAQTIIGLDIGSFSVKVATVTASFRSFAWTGYREYAIPPVWLRRSAKHFGKWPRGGRPPRNPRAAQPARPVQRFQGSP